MPCVRRAAACVVVVGVAAMGASGCGGDREATGFCADIRQGHASFDSTKDAGDRTRALAQFDRVIASAPATVAPDLKTMSSTLSLLYREPLTVAKDPSILDRYKAAVGRVDQYLRDRCDLRIPSTPAGRGGGT